MVPSMQYWSGEILPTARCARIGMHFAFPFLDPAELASGPGHERAEVIAGGSERLGSDLHRFTFDGGDAEREDVVPGEAVLEEMHAAGILGAVAADRAGE